MAGLLGQLIAPILEEVNNLVAQFHMAPEAKAQFDQHAIDVQAAADQADRELEAKLNDIAGQNIRTETSSSDPWVRRARPFFLWMMTLCIFFNVTVPLFGQHWHLSAVEIPTACWDLFTAAFLGYTVARTSEKFKGKS